MIAHDPQDLSGGQAVAVAVCFGGAAAATTAAGYGVSALPALAAVIVALIGARTAGARQARRLAAEEREHGRDREAEAVRHDRELAHRRDLRDLDDMRDVIDEAAMRLQAISDALAESSAAAIPDVADLAASRSRLRARLSSTDPAVLAFADAHSAVVAILRAHAAGAASQETLRPLTLRFGVACERFYDLAALRVGPRGAAPRQDRTWDIATVVAIDVAAASAAGD